MDRFHYQKCMINQFLKSTAAVNPAKLISENLKIENGKLHACHKVYDIVGKNIYVIGFGKAVLGMAAHCEKVLGKHLKQGVICGPKNIQETFKDNPELSIKQNSVIEVFEGASNNLPDKNAEEGTNNIISLVQKLDSAVDHLIVLISGGGSALFTKPKPGISLSDKMETVKLLMEAGADINEMNTVRRKLSLVKGGGLASMLYPVRTTCLIISDVINDPLEIIASGPTAPSNSAMTPLNILKKYELINKVPSSVLLEAEKPSTGFHIPLVNNQFPHVDNFIIGSNRKALDANKIHADMSGFQCVILSSEIRGNVQKVSEFYVKMIHEILSGIYCNDSALRRDYLLEDCAFDIERKVFEEIENLIQKQSLPICVIAGGETTVKVAGRGKGGRNQELALLTSKKVYELKQKHPHLFLKYDVTFLFAGTDGIDGPTDVAGAVGDSCLVERAKALNINVDEYIMNNDSHNFFSSIDDGSYFVRTGHTGTNVMDIHTLIEYLQNLKKEEKLVVPLVEGDAVVDFQVFSVLLSESSSSNHQTL